MAVPSFVRALARRTAYSVDTVHPVSTEYASFASFVLRLARPKTDAAR